MDLKYVMFDDFMPIIFGNYFNHKEVAGRVSRLAAASCCSPTSEGKVTGAGFVTKKDGSDEWVAYGRSESLDLKPGPNDSKVLTRVLNR